MSEKPQLLGYYSQCKMVLNSEVYNPVKVEQDLFRIASGQETIEKINSDSQLYQIFSCNETSAGTLIHELAHAYFDASGDHKKPGAHAPRIGTVGNETREGTSEEDVFTFDEFAAKVFNLMVREGFWQKYLEGITNKHMTPI